MKMYDRCGNVEFYVLYDNDDENVVNFIIVIHSSESISIICNWIQFMIYLLIVFFLFLFGLMVLDQPPEIRANKFCIKMIVVPNQNKWKQQQQQNNNELPFTLDNIQLQEKGRIN